MEVASRPRFTAGIALVGAGIVAASTVSPVSHIHLQDVHLPALRTVEVDLAAAALAVGARSLQRTVPVRGSGATEHGSP